MNGNFFASFIDKSLNTMFSYSDKRLSRMWLQDVDPSQNSRAAQDAMVRCQSELLKIPPRSPDLNPIDIFHMVSRKLNAFQTKLWHYDLAIFGESHEVNSENPISLRVN